jgi:hypothetical protein
MEVYLHKTKDTKEIFYIGIGSKKRAYSIHSRNKHWKSVFNKHGFEVDITHKDLCREEACSIEKYLISFYRENSNYKLTNVTNGGDGVDSERAIILNKIRWSNLKERQKLSERNKKRFANISERKKVSETNKKRFANISERQKVSETNKKRFSNIEARENNSMKMKTFFNTEKGKIHLENLKKPKNELTKNKMSNSMKGIPKSEATKKKLSEASKKWWILKKINQNK